MVVTMIPVAEAEMMTKWGKTSLPKPARLHHMLEDFLTVWTSQQSHILPLRRFLEYITGMDLRHHYAHTCLAHALTNGRAPHLCAWEGGRSIYPTPSVPIHPPDDPSGTPDLSLRDRAPSVLPAASLASATS
ncbi:FAD-dependent oxidoreductase domain-containing protein 2 [Portunus trituberculatus]|uniref:FAD-dependent oxidoreductase domain-containing protein 2 n=1 Tax=Portunus trituberculatus TaxID=210409 RepID=A0A5B7JN59_PORTR|nr:FAD-dependent oxidoreductase domain-containing protein 2 [Portunus trituberculatus]